MSLKAGILMAMIVVITISSGHAFYTIPGKLKHVTASTNYLWGVNTRDQIFICNHPCRGRWRQIAGGLSQVDADDHEVWGVNSAHHIYKRPVDGSGRWTRVSGQLTHVTASGNGYIWGVNKHDQIFRCAKPCSGRWKRVGGALRQIDGGQDRVYGVNSAGNIYTHLVDGSGGWRHIPGKAKHITASGSHEVFAVNAKGEVYRCKKPCRKGSWRRMASHLQQVDAAMHGVYGVACRNDIMGMTLKRTV